VITVLTDTPVKAAMEAEVEARSRPVKRKRLFSDSQERDEKQN
jgi:hypothetical protein